MDEAWMSHGCVIDKLWMSHGYVMDHSWISHDSVMDEAWMSHISVLDASWISPTGHIRSRYSRLRTFGAELRFIDLRIFHLNEFQYL